MTPLVLASSLLARLELVKVPTADSQRALVLIHASSEVGNVGLASPWALVVLGLSIGVVVSQRRLLLLGWSGGAAAAEEATDGVTDGGSDCDTAGGCQYVAMVSEVEGRAYAAVLAIWPKRPEPPPLCWACGGGCCWVCAGCAAELICLCGCAGMEPLGRC